MAKKKAAAEKVEHIKKSAIDFVAWKMYHAYALNSKKALVFLFRAGFLEHMQMGFKEKDVRLIRDECDKWLNEIATEKGGNK